MFPSNDPTYIQCIERCWWLFHFRCTNPLRKAYTLSLLCHRCTTQQDIPCIFLVHHQTLPTHTASKRWQPVNDRQNKKQKKVNSKKYIKIMMANIFSYRGRRFTGLTFLATGCVFCTSLTSVATRTVLAICSKRTSSAQLTFRTSVFRNVSDRT